MDERSAESGEARAMSLLASVQRMLASLAEVAQTRIELAATELEEERERIQEIAVYGFAALFFIGIGIVLATIFLVVAFWETHRLQVLGISAAVYLVLGIGGALVVRNKSRSKPRIFSTTVAELKKDRDRLTP
jgi:uncharacterized membrane protein YqjE